MSTVNKITPCLWFDSQGEDAAKFYVSIFKNSSIDKVSRYGKEGFEIHHRPEGSAMTIAFTLEGQSFTALNGGPNFKFSEAVSFIVTCDSQKEIDTYWDKLNADPHGGQCGWLKDKFGLSWQIVPADMPKWAGDPDAKKSGRVMNALLKMKKLDIEALRRAYEGA
ncbi:MAG: VOC family protein [Proteobacteria bacterium]|nr:VOC family protein [Pseudomonadota bacterium]